MGWLGFLIRLPVGAFIGLLVAALMMVAKDADRALEEMGRGADRG